MHACKKRNNSIGYCKTKTKEFRTTNVSTGDLYKKPTRTQRKKTNKQFNARETWVTKSRLVLVLNLIGWKDDVSFKIQSHGEVKQNRSSPKINWKLLSRVLHSPSAGNYDILSPSPHPSPHPLPSPLPYSPHPSLIPLIANNSRQQKLNRKFITYLKLTEEDQIRLRPVSRTLQTQRGTGPTWLKSKWCRCT